MTSSDEVFLARAVALAKQFVGRTAPNPPVGALCVRDGRILGEGAHQKAGEPHAEVNCLAACTEDPAGSTLYVTLEPCSTYGRTPPCCDLLREKRIRRVVIGCLDPNPRHAGRAVTLLQAAGIEVELAPRICPVEAACRALIAPFAKAITTGLPYLRLKLALTLDGYIADSSGSSRWITGPEARDYVQHLRAKVDAVMVGSGTVLADAPSLQPHLPGADPKWRVFVDRSIPPPPAACDERTLLATRDLAYDGTDLPAMLRALCARGINDVLCEGGGRLAGALLEAGLVDELLLFYAPKILGDPAARPGLAITPRRLPEAMPLRMVDCDHFGNDVLITLRASERLHD